VAHESARVARVSMLIEASATAVYSAFIEPAQLTRFWLSAADRPLAVGHPARWDFIVPGAFAETTATRLVDGREISWAWSDGTTVDIDLKAVDSATAVTIVVRGFAGTENDQVAAALNACEGFAIVVCDLKTLLENGASAGLVAAKARLIQHRAA
jgi:uncharacterized protein YndB with AHSA1/START domain